MESLKTREIGRCKNKIVENNAFAAELQWPLEASAELLNKMWSTTDQNVEFTGKLLRVTCWWGKQIVTNPYIYLGSLLWLVSFVVFLVRVIKCDLTVQLILVSNA